MVPLDLVAGHMLGRCLAHESVISAFLDILVPGLMILWIGFGLGYPRTGSLALGKYGRAY